MLGDEDVVWRSVEPGRYEHTVELTALVPTDVSEPWTAARARSLNRVIEEYNSME